MADASRRSPSRGEPRPNCERRGPPRYLTIAPESSCGADLAWRRTAVSAHSAGTITSFDRAPQIHVQHQQTVLRRGHEILAQINRPEMRNINSMIAPGQPAGKLVQVARERTPQIG